MVFASLELSKRLEQAAIPPELRSDRMGIDLGFLWVDKQLKGSGHVEDSVQAMWNKPPADATLVMAFNPLAPKPNGLKGTGTFVSFFVDEGFAQQRRHVRDFPIETVACALAYAARAKVLVAFMADHHLLGGFQIFDRTGRIDHQAFRDDREPHPYLDAPRVGFERLFNESLPSKDKAERLRFTELLFDSAEIGWTAYLIGERGEWLEKPVPLPKKTDLYTDHRNCWAMLSWPRAPTE